MSSIGSSLEKKIKKIFWILAGTRADSGVSAPVRPGQSLSLLAIRPDRLGDFILSVPALRVLQNSMGSHSRLTLVAGERNEEMARFFFPQARVLIFRKSPLRRLPLFFRIWKGAFDAVIDFHSYPFSTTSAFMALLSGSPRRIGFWDDGESAGLSRETFNGGVSRPVETLHEKNKSLLLARRLFPNGKSRDKDWFPIPRIPAGIREEVQSFYKKMDWKKGDKVIGLHPTLQKEDNRWSPPNYAELMKKLAGKPKLKFVLVHGRGEGRELKRFLDETGNIPHFFVLPCEDVLFILEAAKRFDLFVGGDSGLTHLAALATRVLAVFGPSDPRRWGPLKGNFGPPRIFRKESKLCDSVSPDEVAKEISKIIGA